VEETPDFEPEMRLSEEAVIIGLVRLLLSQKYKKWRMNPMQSEKTQHLSLFYQVGRTRSSLNMFLPFKQPHGNCQVYEPLNSRKKSETITFYELKSK